MKVTLYYTYDKRKKEYMQPVFGEANIWEVIIWRTSSWISHIFLEIYLNMQYRIEDRKEAKKHEKTQHKK